MIKVLLILSPVAIFFWLFSLDVAPSGHFFINHPVDAASPFVDRFLPDARVQGVQYGSDGAFQWMIDEPAYASIHTPGDFDTLNATIKFQNTDQPIVELGIVQNDNPLQYDLEPVQNLLIDHSTWDRTEKDGLVFLQRQKVYSSIDDFLANPPDRHTIATYHHDLTEPFRIPDYVAENALSRVDVSLRGYHEFVTYIKNEPLLVQADYMDMNREFGEDPVSVLVYDEKGQMIASQTIDDDSVVEATNQGSTMRSISLTKTDLPEGVYKVILKADRDIFFRHLVTRQRYLTFFGPVYIGDEAGYKDSATPVKFWTATKRLAFFTYHADAAEKVTIGSGTLALPEAQVRYHYDVMDPGLVVVSAAAGDFTVTQDGTIAFSQHQWFNPFPTRLSSDTNLDALGINFIIAKYTSPKKDGAWTSATVSFDLHKALNTNGDIKLVLSAPDIKSRQSEIKLHAINLEFVRTPLSSSQFFSKLKHFIGL